MIPTDFDSLSPVERDPKRLVKKIMEAIQRLKRRIVGNSDFIASLASESYLHPKALEISLIAWCRSLNEEGFHTLLRSK